MYHFHMRNIWDIALDLLRDPLIAPHWDFDSKQLSKWNEEDAAWERFIDEPSMADGLWEAFVCI